MEGKGVKSFEIREKTLTDKILFSLKVEYFVPGITLPL